MKLKLIVSTLLIVFVVIITVLSNTTISRAKEKASKNVQTVDGMYSKSMSEYDINAENKTLDKVTYKVIGIDGALIILSCLMLASACKDFTQASKPKEGGESTY